MGWDPPLRPLPIRVRPRPAETVASYVVRLARANHLQPGHLHAYLCGPPDWSGAADLARLAALSGRPLAVLQRALTGPTPARQPSPEPPGKPPPSPPPARTPKPRCIPKPAAASGHHDQPSEAVARAVERKVTGTGVVSYAGADYSVGRPFTGQMVQVACADGMVRISSQGGQPLRAWPRRHPPAKEASVRPGSSYDRGEVAPDHAHQLAPLDDLTDDPGVVHRLVDPTGSVSFAGRYYLAHHALTGQVVQVRCAGGIVQIVHAGELVRAWRQRHTPEQERRMHQRPNVQQRTANARPLTSP